MQTNIESLHDFILQIQQQPEISHLVDKIPVAPIDLCFIIDDQKAELVQQLRRTKGTFDLNMVLNIDSAIKGSQTEIKLPIPFKTYKEYATGQNIHESYDFVLTQKAYRDKLGILYQTE